MTEATAHENNLAHLSLAMAAIQQGDRVRAAGLLLTFRHHETRCIRERHASGISVPTNYYARMWNMLWALRAEIISRMQDPAEEGNHA